MRLRLIGVNLNRFRLLTVSLGLLVVIATAITLLTMSSAHASASKLSRAIQILTVTSTSSPAVPNVSTPSSQDSQAQQILSEAQNDLMVANTVIYSSGIVLAIITLVVTLGGSLGVREFFRRIQRLRTETETSIQRLTTNTGAHIQELTTIERQFREQIEHHVEHAERESQMLEEHLTEFTKLFESESHSLKEKLDQLTQQFHDQLEQLKKEFEIESQNFMEASYNFNLGTDAYKIGDNDHAIEYYLNALQLQPNNVRVMERLGRAYSNLNDIEQAIFYLEKALSINPSNIPALRSLALCYRYTKPEKSIEYLNRSLAINSKGYEALDFLGLIYRDNGDIDKAISYHHQALKIQQRPETYFYLSILYALKGDIKGARVMALSGDYDISKQEHDQRIRPVWKILIQSSVYIIDGKKIEALELIQTLKHYVTTQRIYKALEGHLENLLKATGHSEWLPEVMDIIKYRES